MLETITENDENIDLLNYMQNLLKPTKEDLEKVITKKEQIELCLKHKCRVDMWRWNPVNEYRLAFEDKGRYQNWTDKKKLKMLAKSVNMMKPHEFRSDEEIVKIRQNEWEIRKKDSILSLNLWANDRKKKQTELKIYEAEEQWNFDRDILDLLDYDIGGPKPQEKQPVEFRSTIQMYTNLKKATKGDLERVITKEEQIELCLKRECRVNIWRWNPVNEYRLAFEDKGRYQNWTDKKKLKMLAKSVNMMKPHEFCSDEEKVKIRSNEWEIRKKHNIVSLDLWASDRKRKQQLERYEAEQQTYSDVDSDILDLLDYDIGEPEPHERQSLEFCNTNYEKIDDKSFSGSEQEPQGKQLVTAPDIVVKSTDIDPLLDNLFNVNTESMTIDTQFSTQSEMAYLSDQDHQLSQAAQYKQFNNEISLSSTIIGNEF